MAKIFLSFSIAALLSLICCNNSQYNSQVQVIDSTRGLKEIYKDYFDIGVSVSPGALKTDEAKLILQQFNSITPENVMKMQRLQPKEGEFFWQDADSIVAFADKNHLKIRGHTLTWHKEVPDWFFKDKNGNEISKEVLLHRLKDHITKVVSRYKGKIYVWDVVNEVISDKKEEFFRPSLFYKICGEDYVAKAFEYAHAADPSALLFFNDYNEINPVKREKIIRLVKQLQSSGVPIHGLGMQGHWAVNEPSRIQLENTLADFSNTGLNIHVTELDISVYPKVYDDRELKKNYDTLFTADKEKKQSELYKMCFGLFRKYKASIGSVTFWNISDRQSWLDNFPVKGRKDYPLLFDKDLKPKKAFWKVAEF